MELLHLTPAQLRNAAVLKERIEALEAELATILGTGSTTPGRRVHWSQTPAGRAKLARNARKRWAEQGSRKTIGRKSSGSGNKVHWTQTPAGRAKMARLMQGRWDARRKKAA